LDGGRGSIESSRLGLVAVAVAALLMAGAAIGMFIV
jgi:hypothetical protein